MANVDISGYLNGAMNLGGVVLNDVYDVYNSAQSQVDQSKYEYDPRVISSYSDLLAYTPQFGDYADLHKPNFIDSFIDYNLRTGKGALAGLSFGPWGALAGAIEGSAMSLANTFTKLGTYNKDFNRMTDLNNKMLHAYDMNVKDTVNKIKGNDMYRSNYLSSKRVFAQGGYMDDVAPEASVIENGGTHESNPNGGVQIGQDNNGKPNMVEEGEVIWKGYVFPKRQMPDVAILKKFHTNFKKMFTSYADAAQFILDLHKEREDNAYDQQTLEREMDRLRQAKEYQDLSEEAAKYNMTPEEYTAAAEQMMQQQVAQQAAVEQQQMAEQQQYEQAMYEQPFYNGQINQNVFAYGGDTKDPIRSVQTKNRPGTRPLRRLENLASAIPYEDEEGKQHVYQPYKNYSEWRLGQNPADISRKNYRYDVFTGATEHLNNAFNETQKKFVEGELAKWQKAFDEHPDQYSMNRIVDYQQALLDDVNVQGSRGEKKFYTGSDFANAARVNQLRFNALDEYPGIEAIKEAVKSSISHNPYPEFLSGSPFRTEPGAKERRNRIRITNKLINSGYTYANLKDLNEKDYDKGITPEFFMELSKGNPEAYQKFTDLSERDQYHYLDLMDKWNGSSAIANGYGFSGNPEFITGKRKEPSKKQRRQGIQENRTDWETYGIIHNLPAIKEGDKFYDNPFVSSGNGYKKLPVKVADRMYDYIIGKYKGTIDTDPTVVNDFDKSRIYTHYIAAHGGEWDENDSMETLEDKAKEIYNNIHRGNKTTEKKQETTKGQESKKQSQKKTSGTTTQRTQPKEKSPFDVTGWTPEYGVRED